MLLFALVALVPLIITPGALFYFDVTPKLIVLLTGTAIALPWLLPWPLPVGRAARWLCILLAAQAVSVGAATLFSRHAELSVYGSNWRSLGLVTQLTLVLFTLVTFTYLTGSPDRLRRMLRAVAVAGCAASLYGILQYFGWDPWLPGRAYHVGEGIWTIVRPPGTLGHADYFANYLVFVVFMGAALASAEKGAWRMVGWCAAALASAAMVLSGTRGAWVGALAGAVYLAARLRPRLTSRTWAAALAVAVLSVVFYLSPAGLLLRSRVHWISEDLHGGARLWLWRDTLRFAARHWMAGAGPEAFSAEFPPFQSEELARAYPDFYYESPHNLFLDALTTQGVPGLAVLLGFIGLGFWAGSRSNDRPAAFLCAALAGAVAAQFFSVFIVPTAMYFYLTLAMLVAMRSEPAPVRLRLAALPVSAAMVFFALRMLAADRSLELARRDMESGRLLQAIAHYQAGRARGLSADIWYARSLAAVAPQQALQAAVRAIPGEDAQNAHYTIAWIYARTGDVPHTEQALRATLACAPNWFKPHWMLAQILQRQGRTAEASAEAARAAYLDAGKNPEVAQTAQAMGALVRGR